MVLILASRSVGHVQLFTGELESPLLIPFNGKPLVVHFETQSKDVDVLYALSKDAIKTQNFMQKRYSKRATFSLGEHSVAPIYNSMIFDNLKVQGLLVQNVFLLGTPADLESDEDTLREQRVPKWQLS